MREETSRNESYRKEDQRVKDGSQRQIQTERIRGCRVKRERERERQARAEFLSDRSEAQPQNQTRAVIGGAENASTAAMCVLGLSWGRRRRGAKEREAQDRQRTAAPAMPGAPAHVDGSRRGKGRESERAERESSSEPRRALPCHGRPHA